MDNEVTEKEEGKKEVRMSLPEDVHSRVVKYQARLIGRRGEKVTLPDACVALLDKATKSLK